MEDTLRCWKCGADLRRLSLPLSRRAECPACHAALHVCRMCRHHDVGKAKQCREPVAEPVTDKTRANFCDWFQAGAHAHAEPGASSQAQRDALAALFGAPAGATAASSEARAALDQLFKP